MEVVCRAYGEETEDRGGGRVAPPDRTRGVDRRDIFHEPEDSGKFLRSLATQKGKLPFYLYAYCLMTNHVHLLVERRAGDVACISRRHDAAVRRSKEDPSFRDLIGQVIDQYQE